MKKSVTLILFCVMLFASQYVFSQGATECAYAVDAVEGSNTVNNTGMVNQWFKYIATKNGKITISTSCGNGPYYTNLYVYKGCGNDGLGANMVANSEGPCSENEVSFVSIKDETYYLCWYGGEGVNSLYYFTLAESDVLAGQLCENPIAASSGTNSFSADQNVGLWYSYTATQTGKLYVSACGNTDDISYEVKPDCQTTFFYDYQPAGCNNGIAIEATANQTYYIKLTNTTSSDPFDFTISEETWIAGEHCSSAIEGISGINNHTLITNVNDVTYYKYTATRDGKLAISACDNTRGVIVNNAYYTDCNSNSVTGVAGCNGQALYIDATKDQTYYFTLAGGSTTTPTSFTISEESWLPGEVCAIPRTALAGNNYFEGERNQAVWYSYTATQNGKFSFSYCNNTTDFISVSIKISCSDYDISYSTACGGQEIIFSGISGQTYYFGITNYSSSTPFSFSITESEWPAGENCSAPIEAQSGNNNFTGEQNQAVWYNYTAVQDGELTLTACGNTTDYVDISVLTDCATYKNDIPYACNGLEKVFDAVSGQTYYFKITNYGSSTPFDFTISGVATAVEELDADCLSLSLWPNPALDKISIDPADQITGLTIYNLSGSVVKNVNNISNPVAINLKSGLYMVELKLKDGTTQTQKLIVK